MSVGGDAVKSDGYRLVNLDTGETLADRIRFARGPIQRLLGLLVSPDLESREALWLEPCNGIHTCGMTRSIDALVLDNHGVILAFHQRVRPWRIVPPIRGGRVTVEANVGAISPSDAAIGTTVGWIKIGDPV